MSGRFRTLGHQLLPALSPQVNYKEDQGSYDIKLLRDPSITCCIQPPFSRATRPRSSRIYPVSPPNLPLTRSSSRSPRMPQLPHSLLSSPPSPHSPPPAASDASLRRPISALPVHRRPPSRARWHSSAKSILYLSSAIYPADRKRK